MTKRTKVDFEKLKNNGKIRIEEKASLLPKDSNVINLFGKGKGCQIKNTHALLQ